MGLAQEGVLPLVEMTERQALLFKDSERFGHVDKQAVFGYYFCSEV